MNRLRYKLNLDIILVDMVINCDNVDQYVHYDTLY